MSLIIVSAARSLNSSALSRGPLKVPSWARAMTALNSACSLRTDSLSCFRGVAYNWDEFVDYFGPIRAPEEWKWASPVYGTPIRKLRISPVHFEASPAAA